MIERVGGARTLATDVRVIAASNVDLADEVREGRFRQDLYFRLCVFPIQIPPLRERRDDIPLLVDHFLRLFRERHRRNVIGLTRRAMDALLAYAFPGNIRELQNLIERGVIFADPGGFIDLQHMFTANEPLPALQPSLTRQGRLVPGVDVVIPPPVSQPDFQSSSSQIRSAEIDLYRQALDAHRGNVTAAARSLGMSRAKLEYRLRKHGLYQGT